VSTPGKVQNIKTVTLFDDYGDIEKFGLKKIDDTHYVSEKIEIPKRLFKMKAEMTDVGGYTTTRIISKNIKSVGVAKRTGLLARCFLNVELPKNLWHIRKYFLELFLRNGPYAYLKFFEEFTNHHQKGLFGPI
jgi:hypothetical protein